MFFPTTRALRTAAISLVSLAAFSASFSADAFETLAKQAILVDMTTDTVLFEKEASTPVPPSSMSKLMTLAVVYDRLKEGSLSLEDTFPVSESAWRMGGSKMFVHVGDQVAVKDLLLGVSVQSGNDACIVLAEGLAGSEEEFAKLLNKKATEFGLTDSHFVNASGWPAEGHVMSARDLYRLARHMVKNYPDMMWMHKEPSYRYAGITQYNRNPLLGENLGITGMKTGHTEAGGYGVTITGERDGRQVVAVVNGLSSMNERKQEVRRLYLHAFQNFDVVTPYSAGEVIIEAPIWMGQSPSVGLTVGGDVRLTLPRAGREDVKVKARYKAPVHAPIAKGDVLGELTVSLPEGGSKKFDLVAVEDVPAKTGFARWLDVVVRRIAGKAEAVTAAEDEQAQ